MLMLDKAFKFTGRDLTKLTIMIIMATLLFGLPGLMMMLILQWITYQSYAMEPPDKHGISQVNASRLGGAAIFGFALTLYLLGSYSEVLVSDSLPSAPLVGWFAVIACMLIGLADDLKSNFLSPRCR